MRVLFSSSAASAWMRSAASGASLSMQLAAAPGRQDRRNFLVARLTHWNRPAMTKDLKHLLPAVDSRASRRRELGLASCVRLEARAVVE